MDKNNDTGDIALTDEQWPELRRRSEAHRRNPHEAIPLEEALERIERSLDALHDTNRDRPNGPEST